MLRSVVDRVRAPEYVGANRCLPCTAINVALVSTIAALAAVYVPVAGVAVAIVGGLVVWLRGYAIPGTPRFTRRYLPDRVLELFDKNTANPTDRDPASGTLPESSDPTEVLTALGVLSGSEPPALDPEFYSSWAGTAQMLAADPEALREAAAEALAADPGAVAVEPADHGGVALTVGGDWAGQWPSRHALVADLATERGLTDTDWTALDRTERADLAARIRGISTECPICGGPTEVTEDTVASCCRETDVIAVVCPGCEKRLAEFQPSRTPFAPGR